MEHFISQYLFINVWASFPWSLLWSCYSCHYAKLSNYNNSTTYCLVFEFKTFDTENLTFQNLLALRAQARKCNKQVKAIINKGASKFVVDDAKVSLHREYWLFGVIRNINETTVLVASWFSFSYTWISVIIF